MIEFKKQLITPTIAKQYLEANYSNRRVKMPVVLQYANDMANDRWKDDTCEAIKISKTGIVLDGQHRLLAVIKSNKSIYFHLAIGLDDSIIDVLDTGSARSAADTFKVRGIKNSNNIPSIIGMYNLLDMGKKDGIQKNLRATNAVLLEQFYKDENFWQNVTRISFNWYISFAKILPLSFIGGFYAYFLKLNNEKAEQFMDQLATGINIQNETIYLLRNKLIQDKILPRKMPPNLKMALTIKTWNLFVRGQSVKVLKFDTVRDEFPKAISK